MLKAGQVAPMFILPDADMENVDLAAFRGKHSVILFFYPRDDTPACTLEATDFSDHEDEFSRHGCTVFGISRDEMDAFAVDSHRRVAAAQDAGHFAEIVPLIDRDGSVYASDDGLRRDASLAGLAKLKPFFDKKYGRVTPGNSSQITDGAAWLVLASEAAVARHGLTPIGRIVDCQWAALEPELMGLGPVHAATPILQRHGLGLNDLDLWELNEAFAAQVIACLRAWQDDAYCRERLGLPGALGEIDAARLNIDGGAVALGHPVGASGVRIVLHLLQALRRTGGKRGIATICIGGGLGGAMLVEAL